MTICVKDNDECRKITSYERRSKSIPTKKIERQCRCTFAENMEARVALVEHEGLKLLRFSFFFELGLNYPLVLGFFWGVWVTRLFGVFCFKWHLFPLPFLLEFSFFQRDFAPS